MAAGFWFLAQTKPRQEWIAKANLERQAFLVNLPTIARIRASARRTLESSEALFPGYVFFAPARESQSIAPVRSTTGVSRVVRFGQDPARISDVLLAQMLEFVQHAASQPGGLAAHIGGVKPGVEVEITEGPFAGLQGLVSGVGAERVMVLLEIMGRQQALGLPHASVAKI